VLNEGRTSILVTEAKTERHRITAATGIGFKRLSINRDKILVLQATEDKLTGGINGIIGMRGS